MVKRLLFWLKDWFPQVLYGHADWCGKFFIIIAPPHISRRLGRGEIGLELFRWTEK